MTILASRSNFASFYIPENSSCFNDSQCNQDLLITRRISPDRQIWSELIDDLLGLLWLEDDWDGQGAKAPDRELVHSAIKLACLLRDRQAPPAHYATASVNGTIHLEWVEAHHSLDIEVIAPGLAEFYPVDLAGTPAAFGTYRW